MVPGIEFSQFLAMAPPGRSPSVTKTPPSSSSSCLDRRIVDQPPGLEDTPSVVNLAKETL
jgi:hypothetical protein